MNASDTLMKLSGYHWAILLAPKDVPLSTSEDKDSIRWDVTNEDNPANNWRFRRAPVNQFLSISLCARIRLMQNIASQPWFLWARCWSPLKSSKVTRPSLAGYGFWLLSKPLRIMASWNEMYLQQALRLALLLFGDKCIGDIQSRKVGIAKGGAPVIPVLDMWSTK